MKRPKVSVIMGVYNCETTLAAAIDSILRQTYPHWELVMCDDGSTDGTYALAEKYQRKYPEKIVLLKNEQNRKLSYTLNRCLKAATGELIARMDGDDISHPDRFERQVEYLSSHPKIQLVGSDMQCFDETGLHNVRHAAKEPDRTTLRTRNPFFHATIMTYRSVFEALNGYSEAAYAERVEDLELWFRFFSKGFSGDNIPLPLYCVRENYATLKRRTARDRMNVLRVKSQGYRLLGFPRRWLIWPVITETAKSLVPFCIIRWIRQKRGFGGA